MSDYVIHDVLKVTRQRDAGARDSLQVQEHIQACHVGTASGSSRAAHSPCPSYPFCTQKNPCTDAFKQHGCRSRASLLLLLKMIYCRWRGTVEQLPCCPTITSSIPIQPPLITFHLFKIDVGSLDISVWSHLTSAKPTYSVEMLKRRRAQRRTQPFTSKT